MRLLLDSNVFIWTARDPAQLSRKARLALEDTANQCFVSVVTPWELALSSVKGLIRLDVPFQQFYYQHLEALGARELPVLLQRVRKPPGRKRVRPGSWPANPWSRGCRS